MTYDKNEGMFLGSFYRVFTHLYFCNNLCNNPNQVTRNMHLKLQQLFLVTNVNYITIFESLLEQNNI